MLDEIRKLTQSPSHSTIIFSDHGSFAGTALWDYGVLSKDDLIRAVKNLDPNKFLRTIHLHCYSGSMLYSQNISTEEDFLEQYPKNLCSLAASTHLSVTNSRQNFLTAKLIQDENISLKKLRDKVRKNKEIDNSFMLTSDYAAISASNLICNNKSKDESTNSCNNVPHLNLTSNVLHIFCSVCEGAFISTNSSLEFIKNVKKDIEGCIQEYVFEFYKKKFPERYHLTQSKVLDREKQIKNKIHIRNHDICKKSQLDYQPDQQRVLDLIDVKASKEFNNFSDKLNWNSNECLLNLSTYGMSECLCKKENYKSLNEYLIKNPENNVLNSSDEIEKLVSLEEEKQRDSFQEKLQYCHLITNFYSSNEIKKRYGEILSCENSPIK